MAENIPAEVAEVLEVAEATNAAVKMNGPAFYLNMQMKQATTHAKAMDDELLANTQAMNQVRLTGMQLFTKSAAEMDIAEAVGLSKVARTSIPESGMDANFVATLAQIMQRSAPRE